MTQLQGMNIGQVTPFTAYGRSFEVKRLRRDLWHLRDVAIGERSRFGAEQQITEDIATVQKGGVLPCSGHRW